MASLTFAQLQARATLLASFEGWTEAPSIAWDVLINRAWAQFSWDAELVIAQQNITTVNGTLAYTLSQQVKRVLDVVWDTTSSKQALRHSTEDYERNVRADWRYALADVTDRPRRYTFNQFSTISLVPIPVTAVTVSVRGFVQGTDLSLSSDTLPIPSVLEEGVCLYAAYLQAKVYAQGEGRQRILDMFLQDYQHYVDLGKQYAGLEEEGN